MKCISCLLLCLTLLPFSSLFFFRLINAVRKAAARRAEKDKAAEWTFLFLLSLAGPLANEWTVLCSPWHSCHLTPLLVCCVFSDGNLSDLKYPGWEVSSAADGGISHYFQRSMASPPHGKCSKFSTKFDAVPVCFSHWSIYILKPLRL